MLQTLEATGVIKVSHVCQANPMLFCPGFGFNNKLWFFQVLLPGIQPVATIPAALSQSTKQSHIPSIISFNFRLGALGNYHPAALHLEDHILAIPLVHKSRQ